MGLETKTYWLTDRPLQCDFDFLQTSEGGVACQWSKYSSTTSEDSPARSEYSSTRQYRTSTEQEMIEEDRYWDTADRQNTAGERITRKNPGAGIQDRKYKVFSLSGARLCNQ
jgi:hypothetical protein